MFDWWGYQPQRINMYNYNIFVLDGGQEGSMPKSKMTNYK